MVLCDMYHSVGPLREFVAPFYEALQAAGDPRDKPVLHALSLWLQH
jgi:hypothetical protein